MILGGMVKKVEDLRGRPANQIPGLTYWLQLLCGVEFTLHVLRGHPDSSFLLRRVFCALWSILGAPRHVFSRGRAFRTNRARATGPLAHKLADGDH